MGLKLSNYSTMNGSIASANNATLATVAANYGLKTVVGQHSLDIAARITPLEADTKVAVTAAALAPAREQRRLHLWLGLQGGRQRPDSLRPAVYRRRFLAAALLNAVTTAALDSGKADASVLAALLSTWTGWTRRWR